MNNEKTCQYRAIVWKELLEASRVYRYPALLFLATALAMSVFLIARVHANKSIPAELLGPMLGGLLVTAPLTMFPLLGNSIVIRSIYGERRKKTIQTLMAQGVHPTVILLGKVTVAVLLSSAMSLLGCIVFVLVVKLTTDYWVAFNGYTSFTILVSVLFSISLLSLVACFYMVLKNPGILGMMYMMGTMYGMLYIMMKVTLIGVAIVGVALVLSVGLVGASWIIMRSVSKERIADI